MNNKLLAGLVAIPVLLGSTYAVNAAVNQGPNGAQIDTSQREAIHQAIESGDYQAFLNAQPENSPFSNITQDNFSKLSQVEALREAGNLDEAKSLAESLGLPAMHGRGDQGHGMMMEKDHEAIDAAIESGDYNAFVQAVGSDSPILQNINASNFSRFVEMHNLRESGNQEGAQAIAQELGLPDKPGHFGKECDDDDGHPTFGQRGHQGQQKNQNIQS